MVLQGRIAIVTGASSGLGKAISEALVSKGVIVYGLARNRSKLNQIQSELGEKFVLIEMDITDFDKVKSWVQSTFTDKYYPDILINNAGFGVFARIDEMSSDDWFGMMNTNLNGVYHITSEVVKFMRKHESSSHIINIGSIMGKTTRSEAAGYCATKYGINGMSEVLFKELRSDNIKVTCLNSGSIETNFFQNSGIEPHDRMLHPNEIADVIAYILETPDNVLINELEIRPLIPGAPKK
ncbi:MAG: SDR family NAD(P)-dependent oxidoreductase [Brumimicrobium sp.]|nr:SDR family NAD(P)-dependent oxidoreductase [Brumimicrobium sp.]MCO5269534.1 SDR family NAD(P)-dependent oxidoreductase [Brumimicrobium sp.]